MRPEKRRAGRRIRKTRREMRRISQGLVALGNAQRECYGLTAKYATPGEGNGT